MRSALLRPRNPAAAAIEVLTVPAPVGGLNTRDSVLAMPMTDARVLINAIARPGEIEVRDGSAAWSTDYPSGKTVETLMTYNPPSGTGKLFASTNAAIYNATATGAVGSAESPTVTGGKWQWVNFANSANTYLIAVNGADSMLSYNGSTWTATAALGSVNTNTLVDVAVYQKRLFFLQKDSRLIHYLAAGAISGTPATLAFEQLLSKGGKIQAIGAWSVDAGDGLDDLFVAVSSEGEAVVFSGYDPSDATIWQLKGVYFVGKPIGQRCLFKLGSELVVITNRGLYPLSRALSEAAQKRESFLSDKINKQFVNLAADYASTFGWQAVVDTTHNLLVINVPAKGGAQLVMDLSTFGWSCFKGWVASCLAVFESSLYYGTLEKVTKAMTAHTDDDAAIEAYISPAYQSFGAQGYQKHVKLLRPLFVSALPVRYSMGVAVDLEAAPTLSQIVGTSGLDISLWDTALWDTGVWSGEALAKEWHTVASAPGSFLAVYLKITKTSGKIAFVGLDYGLERGGVL